MFSLCFRLLPSLASAFPNSHFHRPIILRPLSAVSQTIEVANADDNDMEVYKHTEHCRIYENSLTLELDRVHGSLSRNL